MNKQTEESAYFYSASDACELIRDFRSGNFRDVSVAGSNHVTPTIQNMSFPNTSVTICTEDIGAPDTHLLIGERKTAIDLAGPMHPIA